MSYPRHLSRSLLAALFALFALIALPQWASAQPVVFLDRDYNPDITGGYILTTAWQADGKLLIGGNFTYVGNTSRSNLARLNADGSLDHSFAAATVVSGGDVTRILPLPNGDILIGGHFNEVGPPALQVRQGLARLKPDGSLDTGYVPPAMSATNNGRRVESLLRLSSGKIMVGGFFNDFGGAGRNRLARLNADGTLDETFQPMVFGSSGDSVLDMLQQADGKLIIAGNFLSVNGNVRRRLARLTDTGEVDAGFHLGTDGQVMRVLMQPDGKLVLSGVFLAAGGSDHTGTAINIARFNTDLTLDTTFRGGANGTVGWMEQQVDGKLLIGGYFSAVQDGPGWADRSRLARLMPDGSPDASFVPPTISGAVLTFTQQPDGRVIVAGGVASVDGETRNRVARLVQMEPVTGVQTIAAGGDHGCTVQNGATLCWGRNNFAQLGDGTSTNRRFAGPVSGLGSGVTAISSGQAHTCVIHRGAAKCWGDNFYGQIGDGTNTNPLHPVPVQTSGLGSGVAAISVGGYHTCALTMAGAVWCWGRNAEGQLGDGTTTRRLVPVQVPGLTSGVVAIDAGRSHTCAVTTGGTLWCWGDNVSGQLGDGTTTQRLAPVQVSGLGSGVQAVSASGATTCALTSDGAARCWGWNTHGQLGDGTTTPRLTPVQVSGLASGVQSIATGPHHTCARRNGAALCWGRNDYNQLGDGITIESHVPTQVTGLTHGVQAIDTGDFFSCAVHEGAAKCWGWNGQGQLGNYLGNNSPTPTSVMAPAPAPTAIFFENGFEP